MILPGSFSLVVTVPTFRTTIRVTDLPSVDHFYYAVHGAVKANP
jgi:hypothetical protein